MKTPVRFAVSALLFFHVCIGSASAEDGFLDFYSPQFLMGAGGTATYDSPQGTVLNPAVSGGKQRVTLDLSYIALVGLGIEPGLGNFINAGITLPSRIGVFSLTGRFANSSFPSLDWGALGGMSLSFAKDLFPDLYVGIGVGVELGMVDYDWGLGADLGFLHLPGDIGFLKDFRWGISVRNMGKVFAYSSTPATLGWPPAFTPAIGASFALVKTDTLLLSFTPDLSFPALQDVRFTLGAGFSIAEVFSLNASYIFDLRQTLGTEPARSLPVSFGASLKIKTEIKEEMKLLDATERGWNQNEIATTVAAAPLQAGIWAFGAGLNVPLGVMDRKAPAISIDTTGEKYISPNFDGVKDDLVLPLSITDERFIKGYRFVIQDSSGKDQRVILNKEDRSEDRDIGNILARLTYVKTGIAIPESIRWDGKTDAGAVAADGAYKYFVEAWDDNGNTGNSEVGVIIVDNTPPAIALSAPYSIFSPDGDGNKDNLPIQQKGSIEDTWAGTVKNLTGETVRTIQWQSSQPPVFEWDGKTDKGVLAPDGVYGYQISATDRAGNTSSAELVNLIIDTQATPIQLAIDLSFFSPNADGIKDSVAFTPTIPVTRGIEQWTLAISDAAGAVKKSFSGKLEAPSTLVWDGKDDAANVLPEGVYSARLAMLYVNGHNPSVDSPSITIKLTAPKAATTVEYDIFSPTGDSQKNTVTFFQDTSEELFWTGTFKDSEKKDVKTVVWRGKADAKLVWDGRSDDGALLPDGSYTYVLLATDRAGNTGSSKPITVRIDTEKKAVRLSTDTAYFAPFGISSRNRLKLIPSLAVASGVDSYSLRITNAKGETVRSFTGKNRAPQEILWDGIDDGGKRVPDGQYGAELTVVYANGSEPKAVSNPFFSDNHSPQIELSADQLVFSPDGKSRLQQLPIKQASSEEDLWEGEMRNAKSEKIRSWFWKGKAADFSWDGKDENGNAAADGVYTYAVKASSKAGITTTKELRGIQVDTKPTPVYITAAENGLSPNGDGVMDTMSFGTIVGLRDGIKSWKVSMSSSAGTQKEFAGSSPVPQSLVWDGKDASGTKLAPDGSYTAVLQVEYYKGNLAEARTAPFLLNVAPPKVDIALQGLPFSPDNDGYNDELSIGLKVDGPSPISSWSFQILDPAEHPFASFSGKGAPSEKIIWNGASDTGELVESAEDYPLVFTIVDSLGNSSTFRKIIPVDILVILDGNNLKVRIASITFTANTADYANVEPDKAEKNSKTIKRLAEIFKKYSRYKITIQGHANLINFDNPAKAKIEQEQELLPLSKARADAIKAALAAEGIDSRRISTVGIGASEPIVPFSDLDNRWKNRRVEFILVRE